MAVLLGILVAGFFAVQGFYAKKKKPVQQKQEAKPPSSLPTISELKEKISTPSPLIGPKKETRAPLLSNSEIIKWTNFYRQKENISSLSENNFLTKAAENKVSDMFAKQYFAHVSPSGQNAADLVKIEGYQYMRLGENLAQGDFQNEKDLVDAWMESEGHRANILNPAYQEIGVWVKLGDFEGRTTWLAVQIFATKAPQCAEPDEKMKKEIEEKQNQYDNLRSLYQEGQDLINQGNEKIRQGNEIYKNTGDKSQAEPLWIEGENLQKQGQDKIEEAQNLQNSLYLSLSNLINEYNRQVNEYNQCVGE